VTAPGPETPLSRQLPDHSWERRQRGEHQFEELQDAAAGRTGLARTRHDAEETELGEP
jgi:hypothetical protein